MDTIVAIISRQRNIIIGNFDPFASNVREKVCRSIRRYNVSIATIGMFVLYQRAWRGPGIDEINFNDFHRWRFMFEIRWTGFSKRMNGPLNIYCIYLLKNLRLGPGPNRNMKTVFLGMWIPMLKIRRSDDRLIFNMRIPLLVRRHLYIETPTADCVSVVCQANVIYGTVESISVCII